MDLRTFRRLINKTYGGLLKTMSTVPWSGIFQEKRTSKQTNKQTNSSPRKTPGVQMKTKPQMYDDWTWLNEVTGLVRQNNIKTTLPRAKESADVTLSSLSSSTARIAISIGTSGKKAQRTGVTQIILEKGFRVYCTKNKIALKIVYNCRFWAWDYYRLIVDEDVAWFSHYSKEI